MQQMTINEEIAKARTLHCTCCHSGFQMTDPGPNWDYAKEEDGPEGYGMCAHCNADICNCFDMEYYGIGRDDDCTDEGCCVYLVTWNDLPFVEFNI